MISAVGDVIPLAICKYCGKTFQKHHNRQVYCCDSCRENGYKERKVKYSRKRRKLIREGEIVCNAPKDLGESNLREHRKPNFDEEFKVIKRELRRLRL